MPPEATLLAELTALARALVVPPEVVEMEAAPVAEVLELAQDAEDGCREPLACCLNPRESQMLITLTSVAPTGLHKLRA